MGKVLYPDIPQITSPKVTFVQNKIKYLMPAQIVRKNNTDTYHKKAYPLHIMEFVRSHLRLKSKKEKKNRPKMDSLKIIEITIISPEICICMA